MARFSHIRGSLLVIDEVVEDIQIG